MTNLTRMLTFDKIACNLAIFSVADSETLGLSGRQET